jgi:hypothetical protein
MPNSTFRNALAEHKAYIITASGIGRRTALDVANHGTVVLVAATFETSYPCCGTGTRP